MLFIYVYIPEYKNEVRQHRWYPKGERVVIPLCSVRGYVSRITEAKGWFII